MFAVELVVYVIIGISAGLLAGLLGISGGIITVPLLVLVFSALDFPQSATMHLAIGTSLAAMVFNAISSAWAHHKKGAVIWKIVKRMIFGIILGSICGSFIAHLLSDVILEMVFGIFACCLGLYMLKGRKFHEGDHPLPGPLELNVVGFIVSGIANVLGIGGGIITVPALMHFRVHEKKAIATSAATGVLVTFLGAVSYMILGIQEKVAVDQQYAIGYLYLPAFIVISISTFFAAPYGAHLTHQLPSKTLRRIFAAALFGTGLIMIFT